MPNVTYHRGFHTLTIALMLADNKTFYDQR